MKKQKNSKCERKIRPVLTPEARENQIIALAVDFAEKQLLERTAKEAKCLVTVAENA